MLVELLKRKSRIPFEENFDLLLDRHMGFEELAMRNIDVVLKGKEPLTPVNKHLMLVPVEQKL